MPPGFSAADFYYILPELVLVAGALLVLVVDVLTSRQQRPLLQLRHRLEVLLLAH